MSTPFLEALGPVVAVLATGGLLIYLRGRQPDPNREPVPSPEDYHQRMESDRRRLSLPYVGRDRRSDGAADAQAWRRAA
jgi:hypothetical protein